MSDTVVSWIRTIVPAITGAVLTLLLKAGISIDGDALNIVILGVVTGAWYALVRWLEARFPAIGWLLGVNKAPKY